MALFCVIASSYTGNGGTGGIGGTGVFSGGVLGRVGVANSGGSVGNGGMAGTAAPPDAAGVAKLDGSAGSLDGDPCVMPTKGAACLADATVCLPNSCCDGNPIYWMCTNGRWDYGLLCECIF